MTKSLFYVVKHAVEFLLNSVIDLRRISLNFNSPRTLTVNIKSLRTILSLSGRASLFPETNSPWYVFAEEATRSYINSC